MSKYIEEYGLKKMRNASADPAKQPTVTVAKGQITLNKAAVNRMNLEDFPYYEVHTGTQSGAILFALVGSPDETDDTIEAKIVKKSGIGKIPFKYPLAKYRISTGNDALDIDLMECEEAVLVFAVLVDPRISSVRPPKEEEPEEKPERKPARTAPFGQMTSMRESGPIIDTDGEVIHGSGGAGTGTRIEGSDF